VKDLSITPLQPLDSPALAALIAAEPPGYLQHFTPFDFAADRLHQLLTAVQQDRFWAVRVADQLAGFFMLRGWDDGFARPSFGIYISSQFSGRGLARLALQYSLTWCRLNDVAAVMLKVDPTNEPARRLYLNAGFTDLDVCPRTGHQIMEKRGS